MRGARGLAKRFLPRARVDAFIAKKKTRERSRYPDAALGSKVRDGLIGRCRQELTGAIETGLHHEFSRGAGQVAPKQTVKSPTGDPDRFGDLLKAKGAAQVDVNKVHGLAQ